MNGKLKYVIFNSVPCVTYGQFIMTVKQFDKVMSKEIQKHLNKELEGEK